MNENIDLTKILKDCPKDTKLYCSLYGEVLFEGIITGKCNHFIEVYVKVLNSLIMFTYNGRYFSNGECVLFPSKEQRDWNKFTAPWYKRDIFDPKTLQPFDKVLVRDGDDEYWRCGSFSCMLGNIVLCEIRWNQGIPYNDETKYLVGTNDIPDEKYIWWNEN